MQLFIRFFSVKLIGFFKKYIETILRFFSFSLWLFKDAVKNRWKKVITIIVANFIGTFTAAIAFGILIGFAKNQIDGKALKIKGFEIPIIGGVEGLILFGFLALFFGYASAYITYWAQKEILNLSRDYHKDVMARSVQSYTKERLFTFSKEIKFLTNKHDRRHLPTIYANYVSISVKTILDIIHPLMVLVGSSLILIYINIKATIILSPFALIYFAFVYKIGKEASTFQGEYLKRITNLNPVISNLYNSLTKNENPYFEKKLFKNLFFDLETDKLLYPYYGRMLSGYQSNFISQIFLTFCMVLLFIYFGWATTTKSSSWTAIVVFLVSLRFTGQSMKRVAMLIISFSKFYPSIRVFKEYVASTENECCNNLKAKNDDFKYLSVVSSNTSLLLPTSENIISIRMGYPSFLFYNIKDKNTSYAEIKREIVKLLGKDNDVDASQIYFHGASKLINGMTLAENTMGLCANSSNHTKIENYLSDLQLLDEYNLLPNGLLTECTDEIQNKLTPEFIFAISSFYILQNPRPIILFDSDSIVGLDTRFNEKYFNIHCNRILIVYSNFINSMVNIYDKLSLNTKNKFIIVINNDLIFMGNRTYLSNHLEYLKSIGNESSKNEQTDRSDSEEALNDDTSF